MLRWFQSPSFPRNRIDQFVGTGVVQQIQRSIAGGRCGRANDAASISPVSHSDLATWRTFTTRYVRYEAGSAAGVSRSVSIDFIEFAWVGCLRAVSGTGKGDGQVHDHSQLLAWKWRPLGRCPLDVDGANRRDRIGSSPASAVDERRLLTSSWSAKAGGTSFGEHE